MTKVRSSGSDKEKKYIVNETSIPLPGTPTSDDEAEHLSVIRPGKGGQLALSMDSDPLHEAVPDSPSSNQSFSSRSSTKSTDVLLPPSGNK